MPSFGTHNRNYSWPPSLHHVSHLPQYRDQQVPLSRHGEYRKSPLSREIRQDTADDQDMDDDPFSHFISPATTPDDDRDEPLMMSAGTHNTESVETKRDMFCANLARRWARSVGVKTHMTTTSSRSDHDRMAQSAYNYSDIEIRQPNWAATSSNTPDIPRIVVTQWDAPTRDRAQELLMEVRRLRRRRKTSRTLSGHRHSWQEPSPTLYTVLEEGFDNDVAVESGSDLDEMDTDEEDEELNSEDEALYAEDDDFEVGWPKDANTRPPERARL